MISVYLMGGLGNQLFQIFTALAYFLKHKKPVKLPKRKDDLTSPYGEKYKRPLYYDNFLKKLRPFLTDHFQRQILYREKGHYYTEIPFVEENILLCGYFQSYKYFDNHKNNILRLIGFDEHKKKVLSGRNYDNTIAMHFRIGDYVHNKTAHPIMTVDYYRKALRKVIELTKKNDYTVIYYCEESDLEQVESNIKELKKEFPEINYERGPKELEDWEEMISMSCCTHNIMANSTFSWWGAYFNDNLTKVVCYPSIWFGNSLQNQTNDLFLDNWIKI